MNPWNGVDIRLGNVTVTCRDETMDKEISRKVIEGECYREMNLRKADVLLDGGANIGAFSLWAYKKAASIIALEPEINNYTLLRRNLESNGVSNVAPMLGAIVGNNDRYRQLYVNLQRNQSSHSFLVRRGRNEQLTECQNINAIIAKYGITAIKLDVEGAELEILNAITEKKWENIRSLALEYHFNALRDKDHKLYYKMIKMLKTHFEHVHHIKPQKHWTCIVLAHK